MSSYLTEHRSGYRYKRAVPKDVRDIVGASQWSKYLGPVGKPEAVVRARALAVQHDAIINAARSLEAAERQDVASAGGLVGFKGYARSLTDGATLLDAVANVELDTDADDLKDQVELTRDARRKAVKMRGEAARAAATATKLDTSGKFGPLIAAWKSVAKRPPAVKTTERMERCVARFTKTVGNVAPKAVTSHHARRWRDELEKDPTLSTDAVAQHLSNLHRLFKVGVSEGLAAEPNPFAGIRARPNKSAKPSNGPRSSFAPIQVRAMFNAMTGETLDFQWIMRILAYHGMRSGEVCQLRVDDVADLFGVLVLRVHDKYGSVKNRFSIRDVPIHPACAGIVEYAKAQDSPWLFPTYGNVDDGAGKFQRYGGRLLRLKAGIANKALTIHSMRHTWRTLAREIDMPEPVSRAIMGHSLGRDDHAGYGSVPSLKTRAEWIAKIDPLA